MGSKYWGVFTPQTTPMICTPAGPVSVEFGLVPVPVDLRVPDRYRNYFFFVLYYRFYDELPASRAPYSSLAGSRAPLQFPDCITCYTPVPILHHLLSSTPVPWRNHVPPSSSQTVSLIPSSSQNVSCPPPFGDTWRGKLSLFERL